MGWNVSVSILYLILSAFSNKEAPDTPAVSLHHTQDLAEK